MREPTPPEPSRLLDDSEWAAIVEVLTKQIGRSSAQSDGTRRFINGTLFVLATGRTWRELHPRFGRWNTAYVRFRRWAALGIWDAIYQRMVELKIEDRWRHLTDSTVMLGGATRTSIERNAAATSALVTLTANSKLAGLNRSRKVEDPTGKSSDGQRVRAPRALGRLEGGPSISLSVRLSVQTVHALDQWIAASNGSISRSSAIRAILKELFRTTQVLAK